MRIIAFGILAIIVATIVWAVLDKGENQPIRYTIKDKPKDKDEEKFFQILQTTIDAYLPVGVADPDGHVLAMPKFENEGIEDSDFLFSVELGFRHDLAERKFSKDLIRAFRDNGIRFPDNNVIIQMVKLGKQWSIEEYDGPQAYSIFREDDKLNVYLRWWWWITDSGGETKYIRPDFKKR